MVEPREYFLSHNPTISEELHHTLALPTLSGRGGAGVSHTTESGAANNAKGENARVRSTKSSVSISPQSRKRTAGPHRTTEQQREPHGRSPSQVGLVISYIAALLLVSSLGRMKCPTETQ